MRFYADVVGLAGGKRDPGFFLPRKDVPHVNAVKPSWYSTVYVYHKSKLASTPPAGTLV